MRLTIKRLVAVLVFMLAFALMPIMVLASDEITVTIDGVAVDFEDQSPIIIGGRVLIPVRFVFQDLGFEPGWNRGARTATLTSDDYIIVLVIGEYEFTVNGVAYPLDVPAQLIGGRTMVPMGPVLRSIGIEPAWSSSARTVTITTQQSPGRAPFVSIPGTTSDYSQDAADVVAFVEEVHPNFIVPGRMCLETYEVFRETYLDVTTSPMTHTEFTLATQHFLTVFNDGHLSRSLFMWQRVWNLDEMAWRWETTLFQDGYFIDHLFLSRNGKLFLADENFVIMDVQVLAIGGVPVDEIFAVVDRYFGSYNYAGIQRARGRYSRYQLMLHRAGASLYMYEGNLVVDLTVLENGTEYVMEVGFTPEHPSVYRLDSYNPEYRVRWERISDDVMYVSLQGGFRLNQYVLDAATAIEEALHDGARYFIVDLRNARGGEPIVGTTLLNAMGVTPPAGGHFIRVSDHLMRWIEAENGLPGIHRFEHLTWENFAGRDYLYIPRDPDQSANPYDVFIIALTSERSFSAAPAFAAEIADSGFGMVIGEPGASAPTGAGHGRTLSLENSGLHIRPHFELILRPDADADQQTLWPDIHIHEWYALEVALEFLESLGVEI